MFKKIILSLCSIILLSTQPIQANESTFTEGRDHSTISFDELEIRHVEESEFEELLTLYDQKYQQESFESIMETFDELNALQEETSLMAGLLYIKVVQDTNDTWASKENTYMETILEKYANEINIRGKKLVHDYQKQAQKVMSPFEFDFYNTYEEISETTLKLLEEESNLLNEYYVLSDQVNEKRSELALVYLKLMNIRKEIALSRGYDDPVQYYYEEVFEREYTADDLNEYRKEIKATVTPVFIDLLMELSMTMDYPRESFDEKKNFDILTDFLNQIDPKMNQGLTYLKEYGYYDLSEDSKKLDAGFTTMLSKVNEAFIFNKGYGDFGDLTTLIHEFGHYNHYYFMSEEDLLQTSNELDLAEVHSQGLEVLFADCYDEIFPKDQDFMHTYLLLNLCHAVLTGSLFDEFQVEAFKQNCTSEKELDELYLRLLEEYQLVDEEGNNIIGFDWRDIHHTFEMPFYYISYANSAIPALELYGVMNVDYEKAVEMYCSLASDYKSTFVEGLEKNGFSNPFEKGAVIEMMEKLKPQKSEPIDDEGNLLIRSFFAIVIILAIVCIIKVRKR